MAEGDARTTLALLGARLHRLEFLLNGKADLDGLPHPNGKPALDETVSERLTKLEDDLKRLTSKSHLVQDMLRLGNRYPDLFDPSAEDTALKSTETSTLASIVLAHASLFPETASRLSSLKTLPVPDATVSAQLVELQPRIENALQIQGQHDTEVSELRSRSAKLLERWVKVGLVGMGECWADWETRIRDCERAVSAKESRRTRNAE